MLGSNHGKDNGHLSDHLTQTALKFISLPKKTQSFKSDRVNKKCKCKSRMAKKGG